MSITITCQSRINSFFGKFFDGNKLAIRLNKKYVSEIGSKETIELEIPEENTILSYNFFDIPNIRVSDGDQIQLKNNSTTMMIRIAYFVIYLFSVFLFHDAGGLGDYINTFLSFSIFPIIFLPNYQFSKE